MFEVLRKIIKLGTITKKYDQVYFSENFRGKLECFLAEKCLNCKKCISVCPTGALEASGLFFYIDYKKCLFCGNCVKQCSQNIIRNTNECFLAELNTDFKEAGKYLFKKSKKVLGRSLHLRHLDVGSCNACDFELTALNNPLYDLQQYGIDFVASPRHADVLMVTGMVTKNSLQALQMTYEAMPMPKLVMAVGACANCADIFGNSYAIAGKVEDFLPVDVFLPGCPPPPSAIIHALLLMLGKIEKRS